MVLPPDMTEIAEAIAHTPIWVWPLFVVVLFLGARNLWPRERPLSQMFILPAMMLIVAPSTISRRAAPI